MQDFINGFNESAAVKIASVKALKDIVLGARGIKSSIKAKETAEVASKTIAGLKKVTKSIKKQESIVRGIKPEIKVRENLLKGPIPAVAKHIPFTKSRKRYTKLQSFKADKAVATGKITDLKSKQKDLRATEKEINPASLAATSKMQSREEWLTRGVIGAGAVGGYTLARDYMKGGSGGKKVIVT